jgi:hypothetical protein
MASQASPAAADDDDDNDDESSESSCYLMDYAIFEDEPAQLAQLHHVQSSFSASGS